MNDRKIYNRLWYKNTTLWCQQDSAVSTVTLTNRLLFDSKRQPYLEFYLCCINKIPVKLFFLWSGLRRRNGTLESWPRGVNDAAELDSWVLIAEYRCLTLPGKIALFNWPGISGRKFSVFMNKFRRENSTRRNEDISASTRCSEPWTVQQH